MLDEIVEVYKTKDNVETEQIESPEDGAAVNKSQEVNAWASISKHITFS